ncbi:hypothetical protein [uncultured Imperialibacter sp.]|uniref:hypothetical protein n=1 Tax=uncultured Imperialibacter sp. TaxID=1672639 RepID=UPI0030D6E027|tara:strand:- start:184 stop:822 length:639 start_codon:yes stop_codon:yes gene_type:complete
MRDIITIIVAERNALLKGLTISFLLTLPFTFLPAIIRSGFSISTIFERLNDSILYSLGFALIVVIAAVIQNYSGLADRKWYFDRPAFKDLDFYGRIDGVGSVVHDLETVLLGKIDSYFFRLNLIDTDKKKPILEIVPLIDLTDKEEEIEKLRLDDKFEADLFFGKRIKLKEIDLEVQNSIREILKHLAARLQDLNFEGLDVDEEQLEMELRK